MRTTSRNVGDRACPYAVGFHPWLSSGDATLDECTLSLDATHRFVTDDRLLPVGEEEVTGTPYDFRESRPVGSVVLDDGFTGVPRAADGQCVGASSAAPDGATAAIWMDESCDYWQLCTGDMLPPHQARRSVAVEPMTAAPNAFVTGPRSAPTRARRERYDDLGCLPAVVRQPRSSVAVLHAHVSNDQLDAAGDALGDGVPTRALAQDWLADLQRGRGLRVGAVKRPRMRRVGVGRRDRHPVSDMQLLNAANVVALMVRPPPPNPPAGSRLAHAARAADGARVGTAEPAEAATTAARPTTTRPVDG